MEPMNISTVAAKSGLPAKTIRYYEDINLIHPKWKANGYRSYSAQDLHKLHFLHRARNLGFPIEQCRQLVSLYDDRGRSSADVKTLTLRHLEEIEAKLVDLRSMKETLETLVKSCRGDTHPECPILADLASEDELASLRQ
jgi:MerR family copper efflux transcriptional regulator